MSLDQYIEGAMMLLMTLAILWGIGVTFQGIQGKRSITEISWIWFTLILVGGFLMYAWSIAWRSIE